MSGLDALVANAAQVLSRRTSRRGFLARSAMVGTALAVAPVPYLTRPASAYSAVCGPDASAASGYTVFCCSVNDGVNECPPGTFAGGWWKADSSTYCCRGGQPGPRYYIDCQGYCSECSAPGPGPFCSSDCTSCSCTTNYTSCDQRKVCCNRFRYGQCHTEIAVSGPVACRVVTCTPPYELFPECSTTSATDNSTAQHSAPCLSPAGC